MTEENEKESDSADEPESVPEKKPKSLPTPLDTFRTVEASWGFPAFARDFPRHPDLDALIAAFSRGDYAMIRESAPKLIETSTDEKIKEAARILRARTEPDPASRLLFLFAAALLAFLAIWWVMHDGPETSSKPASAPKTEHVD